MKPKRYFVTAIGTDSGKTLVSAILCRALDADYWKPIQAGMPHDSAQVRLLSKGAVCTHPEACILKEAAAPILAAEKEGLSLRLRDIQPPKSARSLVIEGAGGCLVPINAREYIIALAPNLQASIVCVVNLYLGCINHSLLTLAWLQQKHYPVAGIILNRADDPRLAQLIVAQSPYPCLLQIPTLKTLEPKQLNPYVQALRLSKHLF